MHPNTKYFLKIFFFIGSLFAVFKSVTFLFTEEVFSIKRVLFHGIFYGVFMAIYFTYQRNKENKVK